MVVGAAAALALVRFVLAWRERRFAQYQRQIETLRDELWELKEQASARERAEAASEAKSRFLATVSHEVRTPLNGILGLADLLQDTGLNAEQSSYVEAIRTSGTALASLIAEILDFSTIEAGRLTLVKERFDLFRLVEGVVELLAPRAQGKGLEIAASIAESVPQWVIGDPARLRQVLINLAGNGVKFTDSGGIGVSVSCSSIDQIDIAVADTGPGVPEARRAAIFEDFEQADGSPTRRHEGTGLGLAISKRIVERMGGTLSFDCPPSGGSIFRLSVPLPVCSGAVEPRSGEPCCDAPALDETRSGQPALPLPAILRGQSALIVAESPFEAPFLGARLREAGAAVVLVTNVADARDQLGRHPDILIVDCAIGEDAAHHLGDAARAAGVRLRLVLFSPFERRAIGHETVKGFDGWLVKPVRRSSLFARLGDRPATHSEETALPIAAPVPTGLRILLAEDNEINALLARKALARLGAEVVHARDGIAVLKLAQAGWQPDQKGFDVILMDIRMPGLDGREVTRRIRRAERETGVARTRIIALTANAFDEDRQACLAAGVDEFLTKPVDLARLGQALVPAVPIRNGGTGAIVTNP
jgi:signal transduction histidine kinase/DNA-binding response OmpR family regulator